MILVTGATGTIGRPLIDFLVSEGAEVRAVTRDPLTAGMPAGVEVVEGDPSRPDMIAPALQGVDALFLNPAAIGDAAGHLLALAREQGVKRVVLLSALAVDDETHRHHAIAAHHRALEDTLTGHDLDWVILRPGMFAANVIAQWAAQVRAGDVVYGPYAAATDAPIHEEDVAGIGARALLTDELVGQRLHVTGPQSLTREQMVAVIGDVIGRPLRYQEISPEAARQGMVQHGLSEQFADVVLSMWARTVGHPAITTTEAEKILGRPARTFAMWVADHAAAFRN
jgi:uncharacterized protein YbjT (DUF2867 family)